MTVLSERIRAVLETKKFLNDLLRPARTPRTPKAIRERAHRLLRHFPYDSTTETAYLLEAQDRKEPIF